MSFGQNVVATKIELFKYKRSTQVATMVQKILDDKRKVLLKNIEVSGLEWSDYRTKTPKLVSDAQKELFGLFLGKKIGSHVQTTIPFTRFSEAVRLIKERRVNGRITLAWS